MSAVPASGARARAPLDTAMDAPNLDNPDLYINRELSLLAFHRRVLEQARDPDTPVLERLRFLCIAGSNLDEFFEVRVGGLMQQVSYGSVQAGPDNLSPTEVLARISPIAHALVRDQYSLLNDEMLPALECEGIRFLRRGGWTTAQKEWIRTYFEEQILPIVSPIRMDPAHPFPRVHNKGLHFIVLLTGQDAFGLEGGMAVVQAPRPLPRLIRLPEAVASGPHDFVFLSSIIHAHVGDLFPGMEVTDCYQFRVTRNSDLFVDEEEVDDLLRALEGELPSRRYGDAVRLEVDDTCPPDVVAFLRRRFDLEEASLYRVHGPVNLHRLMTLPDLVDRPDLKYPSFTPGLPVRLSQQDGMFEAIAAGDILLHHPFESFVPVIDFVRQAANDPNVLAIKQTLYRTGPESVLVGLTGDRGAGGQGSHGGGGAAGALRRGGEHLARLAPPGGGRPCRIRHRRLQDPREDAPRGAARGVDPQALHPPRHRQLPRPHHPRVHRLRPPHRRPRHRRGRAPHLHAAHEPRHCDQAAPPPAVPLQPAQGDDRVHRERSESGAGGQAGPHRRQDERDHRARGHPRPLPGLPGRRVH